MRSNPWRETRYEDGQLHCGVIEHERGKIMIELHELRAGVSTRIYQLRLTKEALRHASARAHDPTIEAPVEFAVYENYPQKNAIGHVTTCSFFKLHGGRAGKAGQ